MITLILNSDREVVGIVHDGSWIFRNPSHCPEESVSAAPHLMTRLLSSGIKMGFTVQNFATPKRPKI